MNGPGALTLPEHATTGPLDRGSDRTETLGEPLPRLVFVLERNLGHATHARNLQALLERTPELNSTIIDVSPGVPAWRHQVPILGSWSVRASRAARSGLARRLATGPVDAIFIHTQVAALLATRYMQAIPTVVSLDATPVNYDSIGDGYGHRRGPETLEKLKQAANQRVFESAKALVSWSGWAARSLSQDYGVPAGKVHVISPGVDLNAFAEVDRSARDLARPLRVLFVGTDFDRKGGPDLIDAARSLGGIVELDIVTRAGIRPPLPESQCRVHAGLGAGSPELVRLFAAADVFAMPSRSESFGIAVIEAMASGLPVIGSTVGAMPELVREGVNGYLVPPSSPGRLARVLGSLLADPGRRLEMGKRSRRLAEDFHDASRNNREILKLMTALASRQPSLDRAL